MIVVGGWIHACCLEACEGNIIQTETGARGKEEVMCSVHCGPGDPVGASRLQYPLRANPGEGLHLLIRISTSSAL